ncbi:uncharacterized protein LOC111693377 [Trichogramma pretiosum]|uniref:uncharacterized protein LOC111693377 n=1 Tax=Trichogramma pretiosum TaxID=7493 RepID=UPI000C71A0E1|nr:uncharacterized protein LOC111693377 [Trichogramma pretiosum]
MYETHLINIEHLNFRYNFKRMKEAYNRKMAINEKNANTWLCEQLKDLVRWHQMYIDYYNLLQENSDPLMFGLLTGCSCVVVLTGTSMVILSETDFTGAAKMLFGFCTTLSGIIFICIPSQCLKIASEDFYITWYF